MASKSASIWNALKVYSSWIESCLTEEQTGIVQLRFDHPLAVLAAYDLIGPKCKTAMPDRTQEFLRKRLERIEFPPSQIPAARLEFVSPAGRSRQWSVDWLDCPVALYFSGMPRPIIAMNVPYIEGLNGYSEWREVVLVKREDVRLLLPLIEEAFNRDRTMIVIGGSNVNIQPLDWEDIVLDDSLVRLVKDDFHRFLAAEAWYKRHGLPFRRGYLFHGPPGNGKSSVIRAMLSTPGISAFTLNPFRQFNRDILSDTFQKASQSTPAILVFEDLDRCFPLDKEKEPESQISLQQFMNYLDGVGSQDGIIVVATANNPSVLDPAILRRPGRFDRVVGFHCPSDKLRLKYFLHLHAKLSEKTLTDCVQVTAGFSFAQLKETYILAGQLALEEGGEIDAGRLTRAARTLSEMMMSADRKWNSPVGFRDSALTEPANG